MLRRRRDFMHAFICIALLFVAPVLVSAPSVIRGDLPFSLDALTTRTPWQEARPPGLDAADDNGESLLIERYYPWYAFLHQAGMERTLPLWNPYEAFGTPFLALWRTRALSPFSLPFYLVSSLPHAIGVSLFMKLLIAGLCAYYAARRFLFAPPYALLAAITFQMSGMLLVGHWHPASDVIPWFPLLLPSLQRMLLGDYRVWPYLALLTGLMTLGGDPETLAGILFFVLMLAPVYSMRTYDYKHLAATVPMLLFGIIAGLALAAVQIAPFVEFTRHGALEPDNVAFFRLGNLGALLAPVTQENIITDALWLPAGAVGFLLLPLWLAVRPWTNRIRKRRLESFLFTALSVLALAAVAAPLLRLLPGASRIDMRHFAAPYPLAMGLLAATAADEWVHLDAYKCKLALKKMAVLLPGIWLTAFALIYVLSFWSAKGDAMRHTLLRYALVSLVLLLLIAITAIRPKPLFIAYALTFITGALLWWTYTPGAFVSEGQRAFPDTHFIQTLRAQNSRVTGSKRLMGWPLSPHGIAQTYSPSGVVLPRVQQFTEAAEAAPDLFRLSGASALVLTRQDVREVFSALRPVLNIQEVFPSGAILLKDLNAHDRARVVHTGRALDMENPQPLRASGPPLLEGGTLPAAINGTATASATIIADAPNRIVVSASTNRPGVLALADGLYPGWRAFVNDSPALIFPVDIAFRGVEISEGTHEITFSYNPFSLKLGMYISLFTGILVLIGLFALYRARHQHQHQH